MSNLTVFQFEAQEVRFVGTAIDPWWVASDVCTVLEIRNSRDALQRLDEDEKGVGIIDTLGGKQEMTIINESGLYSLVLTSRKPQAKRFKKWVTSEVLPSIRKNGSYSLVTPEPTPALPSPEEIATAVNLVLSITDVHQNLRAGAIANAMTHYYPALKPVMENHVKPLLTLPVESKLVRPTVLGEKLAEVTGESWSAVRVNKLLLEQGFQVKNPDGKNPAYLPTEKGKEHGQLVLDTARGRDKTVQSLQWHLSVLQALEINN
jgi:prophage antirepressor-like protein